MAVHGGSGVSFGVIEQLRAARPDAKFLELVETCARLNLPLIEDDPYGALSYKGQPSPKMIAMNPDGVIYMGSFSKVLTPGIRLGYVVAPLPMVRRLELAKQAADLHTAQLTRWWFTKW